MHKPSKSDRIAFNSDLRLYKEKRIGFRYEGILYLDRNSEDSIPLIFLREIKSLTLSQPAVTLSVFIHMISLTLVS